MQVPEDGAQHPDPAALRGRTADFDGDHVHILQDQESALLKVSVLSSSDWCERFGAVSG